MPKKTILSDRNYEIAYDDNDEKFYVREVNQPGLFSIGNWIEMIPPFSIEVDGKAVAVSSTVGTVELVYREKGKGWRYQNGSFVEEKRLSPDLFSWHEQQQQVFIETQNINAWPLSFDQEQILSAYLIGSAQGVLRDIKKTCTSMEEYTNCLLYLMGDKEQPPQLKLAGATRDLAVAKKYLTPQFLRENSLNGDGRYIGHMLTLAEAREYLQKVLQAELKEVNPTKIPSPLKLDPATWDYLCWPGEKPEELRSRKATPVYKKPLAQQAHIKKVIQAIEAVHKFKSTPITLKTPLDLATLQTAAKYLSELLNADYGSDLTNLARPFLIRMFGGEASFDVLKSNFLLPLYQAVVEKIHQKSLKLDQPKPEQFQALPVDEWHGMPRLATHADFVNEQFKNPLAIFIIPDNFKDADLDFNQRHLREGNGGLAGPMRPIKVDQKDASPIYDLCTLGIPTGGREIDLAEAKEEVTKHFAKLYGHIRNGRTIVVPYVTHEGNVVPAFGIGTFADSALTAELKPFIWKEFEKLKNFCNGELKPESLEEKYKNAWEDAAAAEAAILPLPQIAMPKPPEPPGILGKDLLNAGLRDNFTKWFRSKNLPIEEEKTTRNLICTLSTGAQITIHKNKIALNGADKMDDVEFRESMKELINVYIDGYKPGSPPPTRASGGTPERKAIIEQLLRDKLIKVVSGTPEPAAPTGNAPQPPANTSGQRPAPPH